MVLGHSSVELAQPLGLDGAVRTKPAVIELARQRLPADEATTADPEG